MSSNNPAPEYSEQERATLLKLARDSIYYSLENDSKLSINLADFPEKLKARRACFVTLRINGELRGCIGHIAVVGSLVEDVVANAYAAAFRDPRFPPLEKHEFSSVELHISVLSEMEPLPFSDKQDLLSKIRPGVDGLVLSGPVGHRGCFLPAVWDTLPEKSEFLEKLLLKAGLASDYWSDDIYIERFTAESIE